MSVFDRGRDKTRRPPVVDPADQDRDDSMVRDLSVEERWAALLRGQILSSTIQKFHNFIHLADQKAQGMIFLNTVLIPVALNWLDKPMFKYPVTITVITAIISIMTAIVCIYPKRRGGKLPDGTFNLLHFGDIGRMKQDDFMAEFLPKFNNTSALSEIAAKDMHDMARRIIRPKFFWLKLSYMSFFLGNLAAIFFLFYNFWSNGS